MKTILSIYLIFFLAIAGVQAQKVSVVVEKPESVEFPDGFLTARFVGAEFKEMRKQFFEDWQRGDIVLSTGEIIPDQLIRFNYFLNELAWLREPDYRIGILIKESVKEFTFYEDKGIPERTFKKVFLNKIFIDNNKESFVQVLVESKDTIICYRKSSKVGQLDEYKLTHQFYLIQNGELKRFFLQRSSIYNLFVGEEKLKMKSIIRSNHLKVRKENQMVKAFQLFNQ